MPTIFIDLDGVVADFLTGARLYLSATKYPTESTDPSGAWSDTAWRRLSSAPHFFRTLPKMPHADQMMALAARFRDELGWKLCMLTAIPKKNDMPEVFQDKIDWVNQYYPGIPVNFGPYSEDKWRQCHPGDILVDDLSTNCGQWRSAGGIAVQVTPDYALALDQLEKFLIRLRQPDKDNLPYSN